MLLSIIASVLQFVNPFIGTGGDGHLFPAASYPFGVIQAGPDTGWGDWDYCSGYRYEDKAITMFSQTHNPGGGCPDYGDIGLMPYRPGAAKGAQPSTGFSHADEKAEPGYYSVKLKDGIKVEVAAAEHSAIYRIDYGRESAAELLVDLDYGAANTTWARKTVKPVEVNRTESGLNGLLVRSGFVKGRHIAFDIRFSRRPIRCEAAPNYLTNAIANVHSPAFRYTFDLADGEPLFVKLAISTTTPAGAAKNLDAEIPAYDLAAVRKAAAAKWESILSRIELDSATDADTKTIFYTSVYNLFHAPQNFADVDGSYRGADDKIAVAPTKRYYSEFSLWDTFRGAHPFYTLFASEYVPDFVNSLLAHYRAAGFLPVLPKWNKDSQCMVGTHAVAVMVDAYFKGLAPNADWQAVMDAIDNTLRKVHPTRYKEGWPLLDKYGYYPCDKLKGEGASRTLECSYDDWCAWKLAAALGREESARFFEKRAHNWTNVFDRTTLFMRGRKSDGSWRDPFDPYHCGHESSWPGDFTEGNAWQWRWHVLQDPDALIASLGGSEKAIKLLDELFALPSSLNREQTSRDVTGLLGQYVQGNEPSHHIPYLYSLCGRRDLAAARIKELCGKFYFNRPDGLCGNEDHGEMSAWYVFAALGFYPVNPSSGEFVLAAPLLPSVTMTLANGRKLKVVSRQVKPGAGKVTFNGREIIGNRIRYSEIMSGGELVFETPSRVVDDYDIVIYGSSPGAISAAVQAKRMGKSAVIVSPETRIGGLTTGGLGQTDIGNKKAFGGIALEFYRDVAKWYRDESHWTRQKRSDYIPDGQCAGTKGDDSMWTFEPSAALAILEGWERRDGLVIHRGRRLDREKGVGVGVGEKEKGKGKSEIGRRIVSFVTEDGTEYRGKVFIDATYEGDLIAAAGVGYTVGREANQLYGETLSGCQRARAWYHQIENGVSGYVIAGDPSSGFLPGVERDDGRADGTGDKFVQAYCFRMCLTDDPANRIPFAKPANYDERNYELLFRHLDAKPKNSFTGNLEWKLPWINSKMPNRKTDTNNRDGFSTDFIGQNWRWPEASYDERAKILKAHLDYQRGLMWTLANHPRVPDAVRAVYSRWGTCKDEFKDGLGDGWQSQLYVREARRMVGHYVMTEANCRGKVKVTKPVAMGAYGMDSHHVRRIADDKGFVRNEGDVQIHADEKNRRYPPYSIDYGALVPKRGECANLLVPVCVSASHIAFGSIRMEPVFFALGQVAGTAAALTVDSGCAVQDVDYSALRARLLKDGQVIEY